MEDEEAQNRQADDSWDNCHDNDDCSLIDVFWWFLDDEDYHVDDEHADRYEDGCYEEHEVSIIAFGDAGT